MDFCQYPSIKKYDNEINIIKYAAINNGCNSSLVDNWMKSKKIFEILYKQIDTEVKF